jgi:hypothetical protein
MKRRRKPQPSVSSDFEIALRAREDLREATKINPTDDEITAAGSAVGLRTNEQERARAAYDRARGNLLGAIDQQQILYMRRGRFDSLRTIITGEQSDPGD